jgi:tetratricopeptide (TPR) repeat protein
MMRLAPVLALLLAVAALADTVHMKDGRKLEGVVTEKGDEVHIKTKFGIMKVKRADVERIERLPREEYLSRAAALGDGDAEGHFLLGVWCRDQGMKEEAAAEFEKALKADPKHEGAHTALGRSRVGDRWGTPGELLDGVAALVKLGKTDKARARLKPIIDSGMDSLNKDAQKRAWLLLSNIELRSRNRKAATAALESWAALATGPDKVVAKMRVEILANSVDGMIKVGLDDLPYIVEKGNFDPLTPGHHPLWDDRVVIVALRREVGKDEERGKALMVEAAATQDIEKAIRLYKTAEDFFAHCNEVLPNYGRASQIECVRKMVPHLFALGLEQMEKADLNNPLRRKYEMKPNNVGKLKFTPEGLKDFEQTRRDWNAYVGKLTEHFEEINRLHNRFPDELAEHKKLFEKVTKYVKETAPEIRKYFDDAAKNYK